jgi:RHS repeat-associated protein
VETTSFNNRLQTAAIEAAKSGSLWKLQNFYCAGEGASCASNNGNVVSQRQTMGAISWPTTYTYDGVNRLTGATETPAGGGGWSHSYAYGDQYGNMILGDPASLVPSGLTCGYYDSATNRCSAAAYDESGNVTAFAGRSMTYDAENRQVTLTDGGTTQYFYDAEGLRVQKVSGGQTTTFVYDAMGQLAAEYGGKTENGPACSICYMTEDHLGSTRLVTDEQGLPVRRWDYTPFGWEINGSYGQRPQVSGYVMSDGVEPKFTGKQRDYESTLGLDYFGARYFSAAQGRFTTPDWSPTPQANPYADLIDPQTLNLYTYVRTIHCRAPTQTATAAKTWRSLVVS